MALIVQKFGGSSVKDRDRIFNVARIVANTHNAGNDVVVVVSAQGDTTDDLIAKAGEITHNPSAREMDMLLATGEQISISLLAMALNELGCHAISLTGWQAGFRTDRAYTKARITRLETERISSELERNRGMINGERKCKETACCFRPAYPLAVPRGKKRRVTRYGVDRTEVRRFFGEGPGPYLQRSAHCGQHPQRGQ